MKKKIYYLSIFFIIILLILLVSKSSRFTGINYNIKEEKISNFKKIKDFYIRHKNYEELVKYITIDANDEKIIIQKISLWIYENINEVSDDENIVDSHPWTIIERKLAVDEQYSDILSVLFVHKNIDSFFCSKLENLEYPITFFRYKNYWSIIDPKYGIFFLNEDEDFSSLDENKKTNWIMHHLVEGRVDSKNFKKIFVNSNFNTYIQMKIFYKILISKLPSNQIINQTSIYNRCIGNRSYIQKPIHRFVYQLRNLFSN